MSFAALASSALALGFLHGLGADHLMAIAAMTVDGRSSARRIRIVRTAVGFAVGHTLVLATGAALAVIFGLVVPAAFEAGAERLGGALLVALGAFGLWTVASGRTYSHIHPEGDGRTRWHLHFGGRATHRFSHPHSSVPAIIGAVFALSSLRALMLLQPFESAAQTLAIPSLVLLIALFGLGILLSMSLFGVLLARVLSLQAVETLGRAASTLVAVASVALGVYWMVS
jgi:hypothetical protein